MQCLFEFLRITCVPSIETVFDPTSPSCTLEKTLRLVGPHFGNSRNHVQRLPRYRWPNLETNRAGVDRGIPWFTFQISMVSRCINDIHGLAILCTLWRIHLLQFGIIDDFVRNVEAKCTKADENNSQTKTHWICELLIAQLWSVSVMSIKMLGNL
jgi:hypothetical protein